MSQLVIDMLALYPGLGIYLREMLKIWEGVGYDTIGRSE